MIVMLILIIMMIVIVRFYDHRHFGVSKQIPLKTVCALWKRYAARINSLNTSLLQPAVFVYSLYTWGDRIG